MAIHASLAYRMRKSRLGDIHICGVGRDGIGVAAGVGGGSEVAELVGVVSVAIVRIKGVRRCCRAHHKTPFQAPSGRRADCVSMAMKVCCKMA